MLKSVLRTIRLPFRAGSLGLRYQNNVSESVKPEAKKRPAKRRQRRSGQRGSGWQPAKNGQRKAGQQPGTKAVSEKPSALSGKPETHAGQLPWRQSQPMNLKFNPEL